MGQIRMTPEQMRSEAKACNTEAGNAEKITTTMDKLLKRLESDWEGAASSAFSAQYKELRPSFVKMKELLEDIGKQLNGSAKAVEDLDKEIASKFK